MGSGVARALREAIKKPAQPRPAPRDSVLGNPQRRRVIQYLCIHPCGSLSEGGRALGISPATVRFHALRLAEAGYLGESMHGFCPQGFVDPDDLPMFETLGGAPSPAGPAGRTKSLWLNPRPKPSRGDAPAPGPEPGNSSMRFCDG